MVFDRVAGTGQSIDVQNRPFSLLIAGAEQLYQEKANDLWNGQRVVPDLFSNFKWVTSSGYFR